MVEATTAMDEVESDSDIEYGADHMIRDVETDREDEACTESVRSDLSSTEERARIEYSEMVKRRRRLWSASELRTIAELVDTQKTPQGRIKWREVAQEWDRRGMPQRTIEAMKSAYMRVAKDARWVKKRAVEGESKDVKAMCENERVEERRSQEHYGTKSGRVKVERKRGKQNQGKRWDRMEKEFQRMVGRMMSVKERRPIIRPGITIPKILIQIGDRILAKHFTKTNKTGRRLKGINAATYAMGKVIAEEAKKIEHKRERSKGKDKMLERIEEVKELKSTMIRIISTLEREIWRRDQPEQNQQVSRKFVELAGVFNLSSKESIGILARQLKDSYQIVTTELELLMEKWERNTSKKKGTADDNKDEQESCDIDVPIENIREFWKSIVGQTRATNIGEELRNWAKAMRNQRVGNECTELKMEEKEWDELLKKIKPWKATGPDGIQAYWWKNLKESRQRLQEWCTKVLENKRWAVPQWLCKGKVALIPKKKKKEASERRGPGDYRPITCLNICYKILTGMIACLITKEIGAQLPPEQLALRKKINGCTHAHIIDQTVVKDAQKFNRELHMLWIDMAKAYDSITHQALEWVMGRWGINPSILELLRKLMRNQRVKYYAKYEGKRVESETLVIKNGLLQGDALSPLLFVLAIAPISQWIRENVEPYEVRTKMDANTKDTMKIGHIFYMDDLKVYTGTWDQLVKARNGIEMVANQLGLALNQGKCAIKSMNHMMEQECMEKKVREVGQIPILGSVDQYRYLGVEQNMLTNMGQLWARTEEVALKATREIMGSNMNTGKKVREYNTKVIPKIKYVAACVIHGEGKFVSFRKRAREFDTKVRAVLIETKMRFRGSCRARLYVSTQKGGLGLRTAEEEIEHSIIYTWCYLVTNKDLGIAYELAEKQKRRGKRSINSDFQTIIKDRGIEGRVERTITAKIRIDQQEYEKAREAARKLAEILREKWEQKHIKEWKEREVASRIIRNFNTQEINLEKSQLDIKDSFIWMTRGKSPAEITRNIMAVQEAMLRTKGSRAGGQIGKNRENTLCRMKCGRVETAEHIVSACDHWRGSLMRERHDSVARILYETMKDKYKLNKEYKDRSNEIETIENTAVVLYWNMPIVTKMYVRHNRPDIVVWEKNKRKIWIVEIAVSWYTRIGIQEEIKLRKYSMNGMLPQDINVNDYYESAANLRRILEIERKCEVIVVPIVIGCCGECTKTLRENIGKLELSGKVDGIIEKIQRAAINGSNKIIRCHLLNEDME